jgi:hypothetical protein
MGAWPWRWNPRLEERILDFFDKKESQKESIDFPGAIV